MFQPFQTRIQFWLIASMFVTVMTAAGAPTPLYGVYAERLGFSATTLTVIFAAYAITLLATLLVTGSLSDFVGRRPVLLAAFLLEVVSLAAFLPGSRNAGWLILARALQGVATGAAIGAIGAALLETQPRGSQLGTALNIAVPPLGLAIGTLGAATLVEYATEPTSVVFLILIAATAVAVPALLLVPETSPRRPGALTSLRPEIRVDATVRPAFLAAVPAFVASWTVGGIYMSLGPSLVRTVFGVDHPIEAGIAVVALTGSCAVTSCCLRAAPAEVAVRIGTVGLLAGPVTALLGIVTTASPVFLVGSVITGAGFGGSFLGALRSVMNLVDPAHRAATLSAVLTVCYLAFSVPAIVAGYTATQLGLTRTAIGSSIAVVGITVVSMVFGRRRIPRVTPPPATSA